MPRYKLTISFDVDNVPNHELAERLATVVADQFRREYTYMITPQAFGKSVLAHNITNVEGHEPSIIANHDEEEVQCDALLVVGPERVRYRCELPKGHNNEHRRDRHMWWEHDEDDGIFYAGNTFKLPGRMI